MNNDRTEYQTVTLTDEHAAAVYAKHKCKNHGEETLVFYSIASLVVQFSATIAANRELIALMYGDSDEGKILSARLDGQCDVLQGMLDSHDALVAEYNAYHNGLAALDSANDIGDMFSN